jgi:two-component system chemotaxis response regulator CheB
MNPLENASNDPSAGAATAIAPVDFPIVCVGGSAGGLDAYIRLLQCLPADLGMAVVIVNHVREGPTYLPEILQVHTRMPVSLITDGMPIEPNHVYVIPPNRNLLVHDQAFLLEAMSKTTGWPNVITLFLQSMTRFWEGKLVAIIVSGFDGDGAAALCGVQQVGGTTIAQKLDTAIQPDMPETAIASGCIDLVLSPEDIARHLTTLSRTTLPA